MDYAFSLEFFPPKTPEGVSKLAAARAALVALRPAFISVTFGAGGSTREGTLRTVLDIMRDEIEGALREYQQHGIRKLVALRGDLPSGMGDIGELRHANELVEFIRAETQDWFHIEVAAYPEVHPQAPSAEADLQNFVRKISAGANSAITQ